MIGKALKKGDTIGIVASSGSTDFTNLQNAVMRLRNLGFNVKVGDNCKDSWFKYAGKDNDRARVINEFFADSEVDAILCMRGGYGAIRMLEHIDYEMIKKNPKIFVGFSDVTALHMALSRKTDLVTFHGPMASSNFGNSANEFTMENFFEVLGDSSKEMVLKNPESLKILISGEARGKIVGGNLITLGSLLGTEYDYDYADKILFIEEIGETTYKIDRVLGHMKLLGILPKLKGVILGDFNNCEKDSEKDMDILSTCEDYFGELGIPVVYNYKSGHCEPMMTLPLGVMAEINTEKKMIKLLEERVN